MNATTTMTGGGDERRRLADRIYAGVAAHVRVDPTRAHCAWRMAALHVGKVA